MKKLLLILSLAASSAFATAFLPLPPGQAARASSAPVALSTEDTSDLFFTGQSAQTATVNNIIPATAGSAATDVTGFSSATVQIVSTGTAGTFTIEGSNDNTNFQTLPVVNQATATGTPITAAITATSSQIIYTFPISVRYIRVRIASTITGGSIQAFTTLKRSAWANIYNIIAQATAGNLNFTAAIAAAQTLATVTNVATIGTSITPGTAAANLGKAEDAASASGDTGVAFWGVRRDTATTSASAAGDYNEVATTKYGSVLTTPLGHTGKTYRGVANVAAAASATDIAILPGNASNTVYVTKVIVSGIETTAGLVDVLLVKRSTANSAGTSTAITAVPMDSGDAAATSAPLQYTANPTPGTAVGTVDRAYVNAAPVASGTIPTAYTFDFGKYGKPVILSGVAQGLAVNLNGVTVTGGTFTIVYEWIELP